MKTLDLKIVSHNGIIFDGKAVRVVVRGEYGDLAVLSHHTPFLAMTKSGDVKITSENGDIKTLAIAGGILAVRDKNVMLLL